ncbi:MAG: flagellar biosynthesis protein FlhB [Alicyclobacillaceae bacterium]|nr:flagellar biosynthesis protein FlhB [Alicyclobacillaceae bacterium]
MAEKPVPAELPLSWDLQWFAEEKTEEPTPRRRQEARREGQVARSPDLTAAVVLVAAVLALRLWLPSWVNAWRTLFEKVMGTGPAAFRTPDGFANWFFDTAVGAFLAILPFIGVLALVGAATGFIQVGGLVSFRAMAPQWKRISPVEGFRRLFSFRSAVEAFKFILKIGVLGIIGYGLAAGILSDAGRLIGMDVPGLVSWTGETMWTVGLEASLGLLGLAVLDAVYQRISFQRQLRMTKQELKEEFKRTEGNPTVKRKLRERQRALAQRRMMQEVPKAHVVITNPTHYAVALRYDPASMDRPHVVAKGTDEWALRIREVARRHGVTIVENPPLARQLHQSVELGGAIPEALFQAVAEVLAYVYQLKGWRLEGGRSG